MRFRGLGVRQEEAFRQIALGHDGSGIPRRTLEALEKKKLIVSYDEPMYGPSNAPIDRIPMLIRRYYCPLPIHMDYCQWCSDTVAE